MLSSNLRIDRRSGLLALAFPALAALLASGCYTQFAVVESDYDEPRMTETEYVDENGDRVIEREYYDTDPYWDPYPYRGYFSRWYDPFYDFAYRPYGGWSVSMGWGWNAWNTGFGWYDPFWYGTVYDPFYGGWYGGRYGGWYGGGYWPYYGGGSVYALGPSRNYGSRGETMGRSALADVRSGRLGLDVNRGGRSTGDALSGTRNVVRAGTSSAGKSSEDLRSTRSTVRTGSSGTLARPSYGSGTRTGSGSVSTTRDVSRSGSSGVTRTRPLSGSTGTTRSSVGSSTRSGSTRTGSVGTTRSGSVGRSSGATTRSGSSSRVSRRSGADAPSGGTVSRPSATPQPRTSSPSPQPRTSSPPPQPRSSGTVSSPPRSSSGSSGTRSSGSGSSSGSSRSGRSGRSGS